MRRGETGKAIERSDGGQLYVGGGQVLQRERRKVDGMIYKFQTLDDIFY
jgi:hypothetical protein